MIVGLDLEWELEGYDQKILGLAKDGSQDYFIDAVLTANPNNIVVNQSGSPVTMPRAAWRIECLRFFKLGTKTRG